MEIKEDDIAHFLHSIPPCIQENGWVFADIGMKLPKPVTPPQTKDGIEKLMDRFEGEPRHSVESSQLINLMRIMLRNQKEIIESATSQMEIAAKEFDTAVSDNCNLVQAQQEELRGTSFSLTSAQMKRIYDSTVNN